MQKGNATDYVAKWGVAEELTKGHLKMGKEGSLSTWGLLMLADDSSEQGKAAALLFRIFVKAFKGRHQLQWSRGLRDLLGLNDEPEESELAAMLEDSDKPICPISMSDWRLVRESWLQAKLMAAAELAGMDAPNEEIWRRRCAGGVERFLSELRTRGREMVNHE